MLDGHSLIIHSDVAEGNDPGRTATGTLQVPPAGDATCGDAVERGNVCPTLVR
ncbi:hypothetical protein ACS5PJ_09990 [Pseudarthrobacter sp. YS3]|uniref:hypothetical protein n=1 Tax=Pseudarthrobacter sp. YS3 TaxID=3453718 RepID=UPI003EE841F2